MNLANLFHRCPKASVSGAVVFLDVETLSKEDIARIKQRMTPVFVEYSSLKVRVHGHDIQKAVTQSGQQ